MFARVENEDEAPVKWRTHHVDYLLQGHAQLDVQRLVLELGRSLERIVVLEELAQEKLLIDAA